MRWLLLCLCLLVTYTQASDTDSEGFFEKKGFLAGFSVFVGIIASILVFCCVRHCFRIRKWRKEGLDVPFSEEVEKICIPGVYVIKNAFMEEMSLHIGNELAIVDGSTFGDAPKVMKKMKGKERTLERYREIWEAISVTIGLNKEDMAKYGFLPDEVTADQLIQLITNNPFITMGMNYEEDENGKWYVFDATANSPNKYVQQTMKALPYAACKLMLSTDLRDLQIVEYNNVFKPEDEGWTEKLRCWTTCMMYFYQVTHAVLHCYCYILVECGNYCTKDSDLEILMHAYRYKVFTKYLEVETVLFKKGVGLLTGAHFPAEYDPCMKAAKMLFELFARQTSAKGFFYNIFFAGCEEMYNDENLLAPARVYRNMLGEFGDAIYRNIPEDQRLILDGRMIKYLTWTDGSGGNGYFQMRNFSAWLECEGMLGLLHGNTLNLTRLEFSDLFRPKGMFAQDIFEKAYTNNQVSIGTLMGLREEGALFSAGDVSVKSIYHNLYKQFEIDSEKEQQAYWDSLTPDEQKTYGWLKSVYGPNLLDNTQLTRTTYV